MSTLKKSLLIGAVANVGLFLVFWFDLDGKFLFNYYEPFMCKHYDSIERKNVLLDEYGLNKPKYEYDVKSY